MKHELNEKQEKFLDWLTFVDTEVGHELQNVLENSEFDLCLNVLDKSEYTSSQAVTLNDIVENNKDKLSKHWPSKEPKYKT